MFIWTFPQPNGGAKATIGGNMVKVDPHDVPKSLRTLLELIADLEDRIDRLERKDE